MTEPIVYVVEDDEINRELMKDLFESVDLQVEAFESGNVFLEALPITGPGCILLDVRMPGISGLDLQATLSKERLDLPIIIVTAHGDTQMAVRAMKEGAFDFVEKPFRVQDLQRRIVRALSLVNMERRLNKDEDELHRLRTLDPVTGFETTGQLYRALEAAYAGAEGSQS